jgi:MFS family permease
MVLSILTLTGVLAALIVLFFGRKLFWFFVGVAGFLFGSAIVAQYFPSLPLLASIVIGTVCGTACALIAPYFQRVLVAVAGFIAGGYAAVWFFGGWVPLAAGGTWVLYLAGGVLGSFLAWRLLDMALIVLSALLGAVLLTETLPFFLAVGPAAGFAAFAAGLVVQLQSYQWAKQPPSKLSQ